MIPTSVRQRLRHPIEVSLYWSGVSHLYARRSASRGAIILMYHSVAPAKTAGFIDPSVRMSPALFRRQMKFLCEHRKPISLSELADRLRRGETPERGSVVITFDDGYLDNLEVAAPVLAEFGLPATVFLPTGYVERRERQWIDRLFAAFRCRTRSELTLADGPPVRLDRRSPSRAYVDLAGRLIPMDKSRRDAVLDEVEEQLRPAITPPRTTMSWDDVRTLVRTHPQIEIGSHTVDHTDLTGDDRNRAEDEVQASCEAIHSELGMPARHFSFPYGRSDERAREIVRGCGLQSAVGPDSEPLIRAGADLWDLPRIDAPRGASLFRFRTSGAYPGLLQTLFGVRQ